MPTNNNNVILITSCGKGTKRERKNKKETLKVRKRGKGRKPTERKRKLCRAKHNEKTLMYNSKYKN
jgi:hypothetical protein